MRVLLAAIMALVLAGTACAETFPVDAPPNTRTDTGYCEIRPYVEGDAELQFLYSDAAANTTLVGGVKSAAVHCLSIDPDGIPARIHIHIPKEATLTNGRIVFNEMTSTPDGTGTAAYAWGDTLELLFSAEKFNETFIISLWDEAHLWLEGSAEGLVDVYWRVEKYTNSE